MSSGALDQAVPLFLHQQKGLCHRSPHVQGERLPLWNHKGTAQALAFYNNDMQNPLLGVLLSSERIQGLHITEFDKASSSDFRDCKKLQNPDCRRLQLLSAQFSGSGLGARFGEV